MAHRGLHGALQKHRAAILGAGRRSFVPSSKVKKIIVKDNDTGQQAFSLEDGAEHFADSCGFRRRRLLHYFWGASEAKYANQTSQRLTTKLTPKTAAISGWKSGTASLIKLPRLNHMRWCAFLDEPVTVEGT